MTAAGLAAVHAYFDSERRELLALLVGALLLISLTGVLLYLARDGFARGLFAVVLVVGAVFGGGAVSLLMRDAGLRAGLASALSIQSPKPAARAALDTEKDRITVVLSKFPAYRIAAMVLAALALAGLLLSRGGWVQGAAAGLLLVAASQAVIDHYSADRATVYLQRLMAVDRR